MEAPILGLFVLVCGASATQRWKQPVNTDLHSSRKRCQKSPSRVDRADGHSSYCGTCRPTASQLKSSAIREAFRLAPAISHISVSSREQPTNQHE